MRIEDERWRILCAQAATEQNSERLVRLVHEMCDLLDRRDQEKRDQERAAMAQVV